MIAAGREVVVAAEEAVAVRPLDAAHTFGFEHTVELAAGAAVAVGGDETVANREVVRQRLGAARLHAWA